MARSQLFISLYVGMLLVMTGCRENERGEEKDLIADVDVPFGTVIRSCMFSENLCGFASVGTGPTADVLIRRAYSIAEHDWYMRLVNGALSEDPTQDGVCTPLTDLEIGARYSLTGYKARTGETVDNQVGFSFSVTDADNEDQALADTSVFWTSRREFPLETWWKFAIYGFTATENLKLCIGSDNVGELWIRKLEIYYVSDGQEEDEEESE